MSIHDRKLPQSALLIKSTTRRIFKIGNFIHCPTVLSSSTSKFQFHYRGHLQTTIITINIQRVQAPTTPYYAAHVSCDLDVASQLPFIRCANTCGTLQISKCQRDSNLNNHSKEERESNLKIGNILI